MRSTASDVGNDDVDYVIMGQVLQAGAGQAPARQAAIGAGLPIELGADTINKVCASSIRAVEIADSMIRAGRRPRSSSRAAWSRCRTRPYILAKARFGYRLGDGVLIDSMVADGLTSSFDGKHMVEQASFVSRELGITREEQDEFALRSQQRAVNAIDNGLFADEIVAVGDFDTDEAPRRDTTLEKLASLKPVFDPEGTTTAGNAPGVNDGAGAIIVTSEEFAKERGLEPLATIVAQAAIADDFAYLARTPAKAGALALQKAGKTIGDVDRIEVNEAFASVSLNSARMLEADPETVNVNGGAVALGHPDRRVRRADPRDDDLRAAPKRRRPRPCGDLLRRRPGRRDPPRGLSASRGRGSGFARCARTSSTSSRGAPPPQSRLRPA